MLVIGVAIGSVAFSTDKTQTTIATETMTIYGSFPQQTISEIVIQAGGIAGGAGYCEGNLSDPKGCVGFSIVQSSSIQSTTYVFPALSLQGEILNATLVTITVQGVLNCNNVTTTSTTVSYNSTSGYGRIDWSWTATACSITTYRTVQ